MSSTSNHPSAAFVAYAQAFEVGYASRNWQPVDELVTDDVVWSLDNLPLPLGGTELSLHRESVHNVDDMWAYMARHHDALLPVES